MGEPQHPCGVGYGHGGVKGHHVGVGGGGDGVQLRGAGWGVGHEQSHARHAHGRAIAHTVRIGARCAQRNVLVHRVAEAAPRAAVQPKLLGSGHRTLAVLHKAPHHARGIQRAVAQIVVHQHQALLCVVGPTVLRPHR